MARFLPAAAAFGIGMYGTYSWAQSQQHMKQALSSSTSSTEGQCHGCAFDRLAGVYDNIVDWEETSMFYGLMRSRLLSKARGDVLELSAGTGRNLPHFPYSKLTSLTLTDISQNMLQQAQQKYFDELQLQYKQPDVVCKFLLADAQQLLAAEGQPPHAVLLPPTPSSSSSSLRRSGSNAGSSGGTAGSIWRLRQPISSSSSSSSSSGNAPSSSSSSSSSMQAPSSDAAARVAVPPTTSTSTSGGTSSSGSSCSSSGGGSSRFAPHSFDTIVDTFGLCSCENPVEVLKQASQLVKPGGKLLLLEHGRGTWNWINNIIDSSADRHHKQYGCWYNKDILSIVQEAGLQVDSCWRWHFGTTYFIVASPAVREEALQQQQGPGAEAAQAA